MPPLTSVNCHIKCDWRWFWPNYVRLTLPQYLRLGEKIQETGLLVSLTRLAMIGQWARLFTQVKRAQEERVQLNPNPRYGYGPSSGPREQAANNRLTIASHCI